MNKKLVVIAICKTCFLNAEVKIKINLDKDFHVKLVASVMLWESYFENIKLALLGTF